MFPEIFPTTLPIKFEATTLPPILAVKFTESVLTVAISFTLIKSLTYKFPCIPTPPTVVNEPVSGDVESIFPFMDKFASIDAFP